MLTAHESHDETSSSPPVTTDVAPQQDVTTEFFALAALQLLVCGMLAPGDGGRWFAYMASSLVCFDIAVYFALVSGARSHRTRATLLAIVFVAGSLAVSVIATLMIEGATHP